MRGHGIFSLGGVISCVWKPGLVLLPWAFCSAMLTVAAMWDYWSRGANIDYVVLGLAAYELMIGLLAEESEVRTGVEVVWRQRHVTSVNAMPTVDGWKP